MKDWKLKDGSAKAKNLESDLFAALSFRISGQSSKLIEKRILAWDGLTAGGQKIVTCLFLSIINQDHISKKLNQREMYQLFLKLLSKQKEIIQDRGGIFAQYSSNVVFAIFGAPGYAENHAESACEAAIRLKKGMLQLSEQLATEKGCIIEFSIGISTGPILFCSKDDSHKIECQDPSCTSNLLGVLRKLIAPGKILLSEDTHRLIKDSIYCTLVRLGENEIIYELHNCVEVTTTVKGKMNLPSILIGRTREIESLKKFTIAAQHGMPQFVAVSGDAGIGKSKLVAEFLDLGLNPTTNIFIASSHSYGLHAFQPFAEIIRSIFGISPEDQQEKIQEILIDKLIALSLNEQDLINPILNILRIGNVSNKFLEQPFTKRLNLMANAILQIWQKMSSEQLLYFVFEDLHCIDMMSEQLLFRLIKIAEGAKLVVILVFRSEYPHKEELINSVKHIQLHEISQTEVVDFVESKLQAIPDAGLSDFIYVRSGGNPLFVEELLNYLEITKSLAINDGIVRLVDSVDLQVIPATIHNMILNRIALLPLEARKTLETASAIGKEFPSDMIASALDNGDTLDVVLNHLEELGFIDKSSHGNGNIFAFKHELIRVTAYNTMLQKTKMEIHDRLAHILEQSCPVIQDFSVLAHHHTEAQNWAQGFISSKMAAKQTEKNGAPAETLNYCRQALDCLKRQPENRQLLKEMVEILIIVNWALRKLDYAPKDSLELLQLGDETAEKLRDKKRILLFKAGLYTFYTFTGQQNLAEPLLDYLPHNIVFRGNKPLDKKDLPVIVPLALEYSRFCWFSGKFLDAIRFNIGILKSLENTNSVLCNFSLPVNPYVFISVLSAGFLAGMGNFITATELIQNASHTAYLTQNSHNIGYTEFFYGLVLCEKGEAQAAIPHLRIALEYYEKDKMGGNFTAPVWAVLGFANYTLGNMGCAAEYLHKSKNIYEKSSFNPYLSRISTYLSLVYEAFGDYGNAKKYIDEALELSCLNKEEHWEGFAKICSGVICGRFDPLQFATAENSILQGIQILKSLSMKTYYTKGYYYLGELYLDYGRMNLGKKKIIQAKRLFESMGIDYWIKRTNDSLSSL